MARVLRATLVALAVSLAVPAAALALEPLSSFGSEGMGAGQFGEFGQLTIAADGTVYVGDFGNNRVDMFSPQGAFLFAFGEKVSPAGGAVCNTTSGCVRGSDSGAAGSMGEPEGVALGPEGNLFVADTDNNRVDVFTSQGSFLYAFGKAVNAGDHSDVCTAASGCEAGQESSLAGGMKTPRGLGFDGAGNLYVADESNNRIDVFSAGGGFRYAFGEAVNAGDHSDVCTALSGCEAGTAGGSAGAMNRPDDVQALAGGQLAVSDRMNNRVDVFRAGGEFVRAFGEKVDAMDHGNVCTALSGCQAGETSFAAGAMWGRTSWPPTAATGSTSPSRSATGSTSSASKGLPARLRSRRDRRRRSLRSLHPRQQMHAGCQRRKGEPRRGAGGGTGLPGHDLRRPRRRIDPGRAPRRSGRPEARPAPRPRRRSRRRTCSSSAG